MDNSEPEFALSFLFLPEFDDFLPSFAFFSFLDFLEFSLRVLGSGLLVLSAAGLVVAADALLFYII